MEINFNVNLISKIIYRKSYHDDTEYVWRDKEIVTKYKRFLLFFTVKDGTKTNPAGFYIDKSYLSYSDDPVWLYVPTEKILERPWLQIRDKQVWRKAYVDIRLTKDNNIIRYFNSDKEAKEWVERLKVMSSNTFEFYTDEC